MFSTVNTLLFKKSPQAVSGVVQHAFDLAFGKRIALGNVGDGVKEIVSPDKNIAGVGLFLPEKAA